MNNEKIKNLCREILAADEAVTQGPWIADIRVGCVLIYQGKAIKQGCISSIPNAQRIFYKDGCKIPDEYGNLTKWSLNNEDDANASFTVIARNTAPELARLVLEILEAENIKTAIRNAKIIIQGCKLCKAAHEDNPNFTCKDTCYPFFMMNSYSKIILQLTGEDDEKA